MSKGNELSVSLAYDSGNPMHQFPWGEEWRVLCPSHPFLLQVKKCIPASLSPKSIYLKVLAGL
jgi:hypothetical protein